MIDLRSDTLTLPTQEMLNTILSAELGDDGRLTWDGRGEDAAVRELEDYAAELTGMEAACFVPTGTFGNHIALLTVCRPGDKVLVDQALHIFKTEKMVFDPRFGQLIPVFYRHNEHHTPDLSDVKQLIENNPDIKVLCIENTHNYAGGVAIPPEELKALYETAHRYGLHVHMDGARLFNAAEATHTTAKEICRYTDSVMFCVSKGLGAPVGSLVCGSKQLIDTVRRDRQLLGGSMRQAGVLAAPGLYALKHHIERLAEDHANAKLFAEALYGCGGISIDPATVQSNIVLMDVTRLNEEPEKVLAVLEQNGLKCSKVDDRHIRAVFHLGNTAEDAKKAAEIIRSYLQTKGF